MSLTCNKRSVRVANDDEECSRPVEVVETQDRLFLQKSVACLAKQTTSGGAQRRAFLLPA